MLNDDTNDLNKGLVRFSAGHKTVDVRINFREHEDSKGGKVVPGVAGCVGIPGKLCCDPGYTVLDQDTFKDDHMVWTDLVVDIESSMDQEVKGDVIDR